MGLHLKRLETGCAVGLHDVRLEAGCAVGIHDIRLETNYIENERKNI